MQFLSGEDWIRMASIADVFACLVPQAGALLGKMKKRCVTGSGQSQCRPLSDYKALRYCSRTGLYAAMTIMEQPSETASKTSIKCFLNDNFLGHGVCGVLKENGPQRDRHY